MKIINAQAILGLTIMPDEYRVLIGLDGKISQRGVLDYTFDQLINELKSLDREPWVKDNIVNYWNECRNKECLECKVPIHEASYKDSRLLNEDGTFHICKN